MLPLKINDKQYNLPLAWDEVTLLQAERLLKIVEGDIIDQAAALLGIEREVLMNANVADLSFNVAMHLEYLTVAPVFDKPNQLFINGKWHDIPDSFDNLTFGQRIMYQNVVIDNMATDTINLNCFAKLIAIVMCKVVYGSVTESNVEHIEVELKEMKYIEAQPIVLFFCQNFMKSLKQNTTSSRQNPTILQKGRGLKSWLSLGSTRN